MIPSHNVEVYKRTVQAGRRLLSSGPLTVRGVHAEADIATATFYELFGSREEFAVALAHDGVAQLRDRLDDIPSNVGGAIEALRTVAYELWAFARENPELQQLMLSTRTPGGSAVYASSGDQLIGAFVRKALPAGSLRDQEAVQQVWSCLYGAISIGIRTHCPPRGTSNDTAQSNYGRVVLLTIDALVRVYC